MVSFAKLLVAAALFLSSSAWSTEECATQSITGPQILSSWISLGGTFVIVTDSNDPMADVWIKSPADGQAKMLRDLPVVAGQIRYTIPSPELTNSFWSRLNDDGLMLFVFRKNCNSYKNNPVALHYNKIGVWQDFYKRTQIQGHLAANDQVFLRTLPELLTSPALDFPYRRRSLTGTEIPFVNKFSINRVLGGYRPDWFPAAIDYRAQDLIYRDTDGVFRYRFDLLDAKIDIYLHRGYSPADITLALENVPWDISQASCHDGSSPLGDYGNRAAPRDMNQWESLVDQVARHLRTRYGVNANSFRFKMGSEANQISSFCGSQDEYFDMYVRAARAIKRVLPNADFMPGEFAGDVTTSNVSYIELFDFARRNSLPFDGLPRSCHSFPFMLPRSTTATAQTCAESMRLVYASEPSVNPSNLSHEIHQFGILGEQGLASLGDYTDYGPRGAAWHFMTAIKLKKKIDIKWLSHWDLMTPIRNLSTPLISGTWWLYQIFEKLQGLSFQDLPVVSPLPSTEKETYSVAFHGNGKLFVAVASFNPNILNGRNTTDVAVRLPRSILPRFNPSLPLNLTQFRLRMVEIKNSNSPARFVRDLIASNSTLGLELKTPFLTNMDYLAQPSQMIVSTDRTDLSQKLARLGNLMQNDDSIRAAFNAQTANLFKLRAAAARLEIDKQGHLIMTSAGMEPSHLRLIEITFAP